MEREREAAGIDAVIVGVLALTAALALGRGAPLIGTPMPRLELLIVVTHLTALIVGLAGVQPLARRLPRRRRWVAILGVGLAGLLATEVATLYQQLWAPESLRRFDDARRWTGMLSAALLATGVVGAMTAMRRHAVPATPAPRDAARALRRIAAALCGRAALGVIGLLLLGLAAREGRSAFATGSVVAVAGAACVINLVLLIGILRCAVGAAARWSIAAAFLITWSLVIEAIQAFLFYRNWAQFSSELDASWLGVMTLLGPLAALAGLLALLEMFPGLLAAHRAPGSIPDTTNSRVWLVIPGLTAAFLVHLPFVSSLTPTSNDPLLGAGIVVAHLLPQLVLVPLCLRAARNLDSAAEVPTARVA